MLRFRILAVTLAAVVLVWLSAPAYAGPPAGRGPAGPGSGPSHTVAKGDPASRGDVKGDLDKGGNVKSNKEDTKDVTAAGLAQADKTNSKTHSNKGGKKRGLDRADEVAGEHGKQGRANARAHQAGGR